MTKTTTETDGLKFISHSIAAAMVGMDAVTVLVLTFSYVVPVVSKLPEATPMELLSAAGILAFLLFIQIFFVPVVGFLLDIPADQT